MSRIFNLKITVAKGNNTGYTYGTATSNSGSNLITDSFTFFAVSLLDGAFAPYQEDYTYTIEDGVVEYIITMRLQMADNTPSDFVPPFIYYFSDIGTLYISQFIEYVVNPPGGLSLLFKEIKARISSLLDADSNPVFKFVHVWNNQIIELDETNRQFGFQTPAVFVEIATPTPIGTLLGGYQQYDDIRVRLHILHQQLDANGNGFMDENFNIFDLSQLLYGQMNKFEPSGAVKMVRIAEENDYDHGNLYHFVQEYATNLIDTTQVEPKGGLITSGPLSLQLTLSFNPSPFTKTI